MAAISQCPKCHAPVSLPQDADPQALVRCPLCDESFLLQAALDIAPPELIVLGGSTPVEIDVDDVVEVAGDIDVEAPPEQAAAFDFGTEQASADVSFASNLVHDEPDESSRYLDARRPNRLVKQIVGVLLGGLLGLAIGYLALLWIGGPQRDFLQIGERLPAFLLP